jgi:prepilin signal peptidase PulO-like enzyme (type II secretory pathway)
MMALPIDTLFVLFALFVFGAIVASFLGVLVARLHTGQSFIAGRSRCDSCDAPLPPLVIVPIISYIASGGRALCCGTRVSLGAPATEALLATLFALAYLKVGFTATLPFLLVSLALLLALVLYDLAHQILPSPLLYAFVATATAASFLSVPTIEGFQDALLMAFSIAAFFALFHFISRGRAMGFADAPLAFGLALLAGDAALSGFIFSFWVGGAIGIIILLQRPRGSRMGVEVPFAPFLAAGFILAYFTQWNPFIFISVLISVLAPASIAALP